MKIVVGYDGTDPAAKAALKLVSERAKIFGSTVYLVTSLKGPGTEVKEIQNAEQDLQNAKAFLETMEVPCEVHLLIRGHNPGEDIVQFAIDSEADEIVVGVRRRTAIEQLLLGSNAHHVILHAPCPVLVVK